MRKQCPHATSNICARRTEWPGAIARVLRPKNPAAAKRAADIITKAIQLLRQHPEVGRPAEGMNIEYRELPIDFGDSGHITLYRYEGDFVTILALRHQKEVGY